MIFQTERECSRDPAGPDDPIPLKGGVFTASCYRAPSRRSMGTAHCRTRILARMAVKDVVTEPEAASAPETTPVATPAVPSKTPKTKASAPKPAPKASAINTPAVSIEESLADPNVIVSLITGEKFKMLRLHLTKHGLTETEYRARFNLPDDYPMVAPAYAAM